MEKKLDIIYEDKELIVINKPSKLLTIGNDKNPEHNLYRMVSSYVKKKHPKNKIFIVHRLDRDTSGIVLFSKNEKLKMLLQNRWEEIAKVREYQAVVNGSVKENEFTIKNYLKESSTLQVFSTNNTKDGKLAITHVKVISKSKAYSYLKILIDTGRKNQIRVHLSELEHPIIGDKKYGSLKNPIGRLGLHANRLVIIHPITKKEMEFIAKTPKEMKKIIESLES